MRGHQGESSSGDGGPIRDIEAHSNGRLVVSAGERVAQLWDVMSFTRLRRLNINSDVAISKVIEAPRALYSPVTFNLWLTGFLPADERYADYVLQGRHHIRLEYRHYDSSLRIDCGETKPQRNGLFNLSLYHFSWFW